MGYDTYLDGEVWAAADAQLALDQSVIVCTSGTRPSSPVEGMTIYQTDDDRVLVYNGAAWVTITKCGASVATSQTTASTSFTDLATAGPAVTLQTGTKAFVTVSAGFGNSVATSLVWMGYAVSGATTIAAADTNAMLGDCTSASGVRTQQSFEDYIAALTAGVNVITSKYRTNANTGTWVNRRESVQAVP